MSLFLDGPAGRLEARLWEPDGPARVACAVCHPHPLGGGTMHTTAVFRLARGLQEAGALVLRFNFRGVGLSAGVHDGKGAEEEDLVAALDWLEARQPSLPLWAAGFSFGARTVASRARTEPRIRRVALVALPVRAYDCSFLEEVEQPGALFMAGRDEFGTLAELERQFPSLPARWERHELPEADHYFTGQGEALQELVRSWAARALA